jgi:hypothetical protein
MNDETEAVFSEQVDGMLTILSDSLSDAHAAEASQLTEQITDLMPRR